MALGAQRSDVLGLVVRQGMTLAAIGVVAGLAGAFGLTRVMASLLFNVRPHDPTTYLAISRLLFAGASCREARPGESALARVRSSAVCPGQRKILPANYANLREWNHE